MEKNIPKTELLFKSSKPIDELTIEDGIQLMVNEHMNAAIEVRKSSRLIEKAVKKIFSHLKEFKDGRLIYVGAGTSGRIGVQDGVELFPTFNWPKDRLDFLIAGGMSALIEAIENAEDDTFSASKSVNEIDLNKKDVVIGLAASGNTPFTCKVMEEAKNKKALTIVISNNPYGKILEFGEIKIILDTKEEVIAGSTRLKAGTSQKICLNIISSLVMVKLGKIKKGLMTNLVITNKKLMDRSKRIRDEIE